VKTSDDAPDLSNAISRRQWLLRLGEMVALAGVSGIVPSKSPLAFGQDRVELPPGLYLPSSDHLVHALSSGNRWITPPPGTETDYALPAAAPYRPKFFSAEEFAVITRVVEVILGRIEPDALAQTAQWIDLWFHSSIGLRQAAQRLGPLHRVLAAAYYGESAVKELETADPPAIAHAGLTALHKAANEKYRGDFATLNAEQQAELLRLIGGMNSEDPLVKFFGLIRGEAIRGYYTSAAGLKELDYKGNAYYGECPACGLIPESG